jgi:hypothetical protein
MWVMIDQINAEGGFVRVRKHFTLLPNRPARTR